MEITNKRLREAHKRLTKDVEKQQTQMDKMGKEKWDLEIKLNKVIKEKEKLERVIQDYS